MPSARCPECGNRVRIRKDEAQLRCSQCGEKFDPPEEDEAEERAPRRRPRYKADAPRSSGTKIAAIVVGSLLLLAVVGLAVVLIVRKSGRDGPSQPVDSAKVTMANFKSLRPGMTLPEVENVLGGSRSSSEDDYRNALRQAGFDRSLEDTMGTYQGLLGEITAWRRWEGKDLRVWVAFVQTKDGPRAAYSTSLTPFHGAYKSESGFIVSGARELEKASEDRSQESAIRNDPKWVRGPQARELILGEWRDERANGYVFGPNGKLTEWSVFAMELNNAPSYRITGDREVEITIPSPFNPPPGHPSPPGFVNQPPTISRYEYYVNQDELALIDVSGHGMMGAATLHRTLYRMPIRAGSTGETNLVNPLLADLKGTDVDKRNHAFTILRHLAKGLAVALPALTEMLRGPDPNAAELAAALIGDMKEAAAPAVPTLVALVRSTNVKQSLLAMQTLGHIGPAAKDALPVLWEVAQKSRSNELRNEAERTIRSITNNNQ